MSDALNAANIGRLNEAMKQMTKRLENLEIENKSIREELQKVLSQNIELNQKYIMLMVNTRGSGPTS